VIEEGSVVVDYSVGTDSFMGYSTSTDYSRTEFSPADPYSLFVASLVVDGKSPRDTVLSLIYFKSVYEIISKLVTACMEDSIDLGESILFLLNEID
jgi:hypothetical protein